MPMNTIREEEQGCPRHATGEIEGREGKDLEGEPNIPATTKNDKEIGVGNEKGEDDKESSKATRGLGPPASDAEKPTANDSREANLDGLMFLGFG